MSKSTIEVADILKAHICDYQKVYRMPKEHYKVVYDILSCRTSYLGGGHVEKCDHCGEERIAYNSCCNRHCPKCQCIAKEGFRKLEMKLWSKNWVVDIEDPIDRPEYVLEYVGRYTHRVAISNHRIQSFENGKVTFTYKDREKGTTKYMTLDAVEFIRRFLLHVLPKKFMRIRHIGFLANRCKKGNLEKCRKFFGVSENMIRESPSVQEMMLKLTGQDILLCPKCKKGQFKISKEIRKRTGMNPFYIIHPQELRKTG